MDVTSRARLHAALGDETRLRLVEELWLNDRTPLQLRRLVGIDSNLMSHHLDVLEDAGAVTRRVSSGDARRRYVTVSEQIGPFVARTPLSVRSVLFVCTHNSARSQFAEALVNDATSIRAESAGTTPSRVVHPKAVKVAGERGLDISNAVPKSYGEVAGEPDLVVSVCDRACEAPLPFRARRFHWSVPDPVETGRLDGFRDAFEDISHRVGLLMNAIE